MKKTIKYILGIISSLLIFISCSDYLDIQPEDKYLEETVFASEASVQTTINGIYMDMTSKSTYGGQLTMSTVDVLAQRYKAYSNTDKYYNLANYDFNQAGVQSNFDAIWTNMYVRILNVNKVIENLDKNIAKIPAIRLNILKGEVFGLRAMLHFDLLRLFGPVYSTNPSAKSIPYYDSATTEIKPLLPASEVIDNVLNDLATSLTFLKDDPVRTYGKIDVSEDEDTSTGFNGSFFYRFRNLRLNYFAAKALQARVFLYADKKTEALTAAKEVIAEASQWFEWTDPQDVISASTPDRVFSSEVLFGLQNFQIYDRFDDFFKSSIADSDILAPDQTRLDGIFEGNLNDYRYSSSWAIPTDGTKTYKTFLKFSDVSSSYSFQYMQPLIRMSEMYYIAAETEPDINIATGYLNAVRGHRGLPNLDPAQIDLPAELLKEYKKEFYGEGQLFYYYKRKNMNSIENGSSASGTINMDETKYVLPLPESETAYRNN